MGSFNIQCCVSNQVISEGNPCYTVPILQSRTYSAAEVLVKDQKLSLYGVANSMCSPDSLWSPVAPFIEGKYADYGNVDPIDTPANRRAMLEFYLMLLRSAPVVTEGENHCHDVPFNMTAFVKEKAPKLVETLSDKKRFDTILVEDLDFKELTDIWEYVGNVAGENRLFCGDYSGVIRPVQFAVVHKITAERMKRYVEDYITDKAHTLELKQYIQNEVAEFEAETIALFEKDPDYRTHAIRQHLRDSLKLHMSSEAHGLLFAFHSETSDLIDGYMDKTLPISDLADKLAPLMTGVYVMKAMTWLNLKFSPISYVGQDYDNSGGKSYAELIADISKEVSRQQDEKYGGFDNDDEGDEEASDSEARK
jgi:hypothetical protein